VNVAKLFENNGAYIKPGGASYHCYTQAYKLVTAKVIGSTDELGAIVRGVADTTSVLSDTLGLKFWGGT
jgi:hypothetical protein